MEQTTTDPRGTGQTEANADNTLEDQCRGAGNSSPCPYCVGPETD